MSPERSRRGVVRPIRTLGDPVLRTPCDPVRDFDEALRSLVDDMFASMYAADGVGLAANQIGVGLCVVVYDCPVGTDEDASVPNAVGLVVNPVLVRTAGDVVEDVEGCLSVPGVDWDTPRHTLAVVAGFDAGGQPVTVHGAGMLARCLQHETDHLAGSVYLDRLPRRQRGRAFREWDAAR